MIWGFSRMPKSSTMKADRADSISSLDCRLCMEPKASPENAAAASANRVIHLDEARRRWTASRLLFAASPCVTISCQPVEDGFFRGVVSAVHRSGFFFCAPCWSPFGSVSPATSGSGIVIATRSTCTMPAGSTGYRRGGAGAKPGGIRGYPRVERALAVGSRS